MSKAARLRRGEQTLNPKPNPYGGGTGTGTL